MYWEYQVNGNIRHPINSMGTKEYQENLKIMEDYLGCPGKHKMVLPYFIIDDYQPYSKRRKQVMAIYMSLVNFGLDLKDDHTAKSKRASRFSSADVLELACTDSYAKLRSPEEALKLLEAAQRLGVDFSKDKTLKDNGLASFSPLWQLMWFRNNYFDRFGLCYLHNELRGSWERHTLYLGAKKGVAFRNTVDARVDKFQKYTNLEVGPGIYIKRNNSQVNREVLCLNLFSAGQIDWWVQTSPFILHDLLEPQEFDLWMTHMELDQLLCCSSLSESDLQKLHSLITKFRRQFKEQLGSRAPPKKKGRKSRAETLKVTCSKCKKKYLLTTIHAEMPILHELW